MWEINNIFCIVLFKYEHVGSNEQDIILVWPKDNSATIFEITVQASSVLILNY